MFAHWPLLSLLIWVPVLGGIAVLLTGGDASANRARWIALFFSLINVALCTILYLNFNNHQYTMQFTETYNWIPAYGIHYALGVDGISLPLVMLTVFTTLLVILSSWETVHKKVSQYLAAFLIMQGMVIGVFAALDTLLFYIFWEGMLIPMYLSIGIWGSDNRSYAAIKFFMFTFLGSALMLVAFLYLRIQVRSFYILDLYAAPLGMTVQIFIFLAFLLAFAVKIPMWPVHTWLPDAHTEAPAGGSVVLAALMLKMGGYGFLRFSLPIVPDACRALEWVMIILSLIAIVYIGFIALAQTDMKKLIAYSSVAHMGFVTLGCFMIYVIVQKTGNLLDASMSLDGALVQMISHAFGSGAMFLSFGMLYERLHTRLISRFGGIARPMPVFAAFFMVFALSNVGLPGTSGFVGEFLVIISSFQGNVWVALFAALTLVIGAAYTLWMYKRVFYGHIVNEEVAMLQDVNPLECVIFILTAGAVFFIGLYPAPLLDIFHASVGHLLEISMRSKLG
ncbi:MAG TPA: NADH-quinone oxidoreductase subunit M [Gammaproteobacteria bacterium]|nr:NADH-quinone oxidoreductase subunit M [Gammaproteobacteria bacterium]